MSEGRRKPTNNPSPSKVANQSVEIPEQQPLEASQKRKRGRPKGSKNRPKTEDGITTLKDPKVPKRPVGRPPKKTRPQTNADAGPSKPKPESSRQQAKVAPKKLEEDLEEEEEEEEEEGFKDMPASKRGRTSASKAT